MTIAITRGVSERFNECELTHIDRSPIDVGRARRQHQAYVAALSERGCQVIELPQQPNLPDSVFVEDAAFILAEVAVITRPGALSRRPETGSIASVLSQYIPLLFVTEPATVDGGDVLVLGKQIHVGVSTRSNQAAIDQIQELVRAHGYRVAGVQMHDCLHLKSAVTCIDGHTLLINKKWLDPTPFSEFDCIEIDPAEPYAANCLPINGEIIFPTAFPRTAALLREKGHKICSVEVDELAKAEGAVTCCSLVLDHVGPLNRI